MHEDDSFRDKMPFHVEPEEFDDGSDGFKNLRNSLDQPASYCWTEATFVSLASMKFRPENGKGRWCTLCRHRPTTLECSNGQCPHKFVCVNCHTPTGVCLFCRDDLGNQQWLASLVSDSLGSTTFGVNTLKDRRDQGVNLVPLMSTVGLIEGMMDLRLKMSGIDEELVAPRRVVLPTGPNIALGMH